MLLAELIVQALHDKQSLSSRMARGTLAENHGRQNGEKLSMAPKIITWIIHCSKTLFILLG